MPTARCLLLTGIAVVKTLHVERIRRILQNDLENMPFWRKRSHADGSTMVRLATSPSCRRAAIVPALATVIIT